MTGLSIGHTISAGEEIQKNLPQTKVVKAINTVFAQLIGADKETRVFYVGNDEAAAKQLI